MNIKQVLQTHPGYLKKGNQWLADNFNATVEQVIQARKSLELKSEQRLLFFDIETSPLQVYAWGLYDQNISTKAIIKDWYVLTWSAKWFGEDTMYRGKLTPQEAINADDKRIVEDLWYLLDEATIVCGHNSVKFDHKKMNTRFLMHGFPPPSPYHKIDTLKIARANFAITSNKLEYLNEVLDISRKIENEGLQLWIDCMNGSQKALDTMSNYNDGDVVGLEELYMKLRPWIKGHPNLTEDKDTCPTCSSTNIVDIGSFGKLSRYTTYRCNDCGALSKSSKALKVDRSNVRSY